MKTYKLASEVIEKNQAAIVIFTRGEFFEFDSAGNGSTGHWKASAASVEKMDKVIVCLRGAKVRDNRIFLGNFTGSKPSSLVPGRLVIRFSALQEVGTTDMTWTEFSGCQGPVRYILG